MRVRLVPWLVSFAVGTLLGVALLDLLPESLESLKPTTAFGTLLASILAFFTFEKFLLWRHCHHDHCDLHQSAAPLILIGDAFHNFIDGAVIAAATYISVPLGVTTAARRGRARDPAGGGRLRHPPRRGLQPGQGLVAQRAVGRVGNRGRAARRPDD